MRRIGLSKARRVATGAGRRLYRLEDRIAGIVRNVGDFGLTSERLAPAI